MNWLNRRIFGFLTLFLFVVPLVVPLNLEIEEVNEREGKTELEIVLAVNKSTKNKKKTTYLKIVRFSSLINSSLDPFLLSWPSKGESEEMPQSSLLSDPDLSRAPPVKPV